MFFFLVEIVFLFSSRSRSCFFWSKYCFLFFFLNLTFSWSKAFFFFFFLNFFFLYINSHPRALPDACYEITGSVPRNQSFLHYLLHYTFTSRSYWPGVFSYYMRPGVLWCYWQRGVMIHRPVQVSTPTPTRQVCYDATGKKCYAPVN